MKDKIWNSLLVVALVSCFSVVSTMPNMPVIEASLGDYFLDDTGGGIAELSTEEAYSGTTSVKLATVASTEWARIVIPVGDKTLSQIASISYWAKVTATAEPLGRHRPWVGIYLDDPIGGDGDPSTYEYYIQAEPVYAYPNGAFGGVLNTWEIWDTNDAAHPLRWVGLESPDLPYEAPLLADYISGAAVSYLTSGHGLQSFASREYGSLTVIKITFMCGYGTNWENFTGYVDHASVNGVVYDFDPVPVGGQAYPINTVGLIAPWIALAAAIIAGASLLGLRRRRAHS